MPDDLEPLVQRLKGVAGLDEDGARLLRNLAFQTRRVAKGEQLYRAGETGLSCHVLIEGCVSRYKMRQDGRASITAFELSGDIINLESLLLDRVDCAAKVNSPATIAFVEQEAVSRILQKSHNLQFALWRYSLVKSAALEEWLLNIGGRSARSRIAHLLCELHSRLVSVGASTDYASRLHASSLDIADAMGIQQVIVTRSLRELVSRDVIALTDGLIVIRDAQLLAKLGDFQPNYLHIGSQGPHEC